jgi:hypothetical protein
MYLTATKQSVALGDLALDMCEMVKVFSKVFKGSGICNIEIPVVSENFPVRLLGTRFKARNCIGEPCPWSLTGTFC